MHGPRATSLHRKPNVQQTTAAPQVPTDFYELLGLPFDDEPSRVRLLLTAAQLLSLSSVDEPPTPGDDFSAAVKSAYRKLQKLAHPDIAGESATELAALLNLAYVTLSDSSSRAAYDAELRTWRKCVGTSVMVAA
jgi:hypothetical protein